MISDLNEGFYLKELLVKPAKGQVTGRLRSLHLAPRAMEVLVCLARQPGQTISRESLISSVWKDGGSNEALSHAISEIRHVLDDRPERPEYIETVPREGYRLLVAPTESPAVGRGSQLEATNPASAMDIGLFDSLKQRGVLETGLAYLVFGWLIIQVADILFDQLHFPPWAGTFVTVGVIAGFPIALVLSWFLEFRHGRAELQGPGPHLST